MYTKQHFNDMAQFMRYNRPHDNHDDPSTFQRMLADYWRMLVERQADHFGRINQQFDRDKYLKAAGIEPAEWAILKREVNQDADTSQTNARG